MQVSIVKPSLRIMSDVTDFDPEITMLISACLTDLEMSGLVVDESDPLVVQAVITYCKAHFGIENSDSEKYQKSYDSMKANLLVLGEIFV